MYCNNCGALNPEGASFCNKCGKSMGGGIVIKPSGSNTSYTAAPLAPTVPKGSGFGTYRSSAAGTIISTIKRAVTSPLFFVIAIVYSIGAVISFVQTLISVYQMSDLGMLVTSAASFPGDDGWTMLGQLILMTIYIMAIFSLIIPVVITVGLWLTLYSGFMSGPDRMNHSGFYVTKIGVYIQKGIMIAITVIIEIVFLKVLFDMIDAANKMKDFYYGYEYPTGEIFNVLFINVIIVTLFSLMSVYYHKCAETIDEFMYSVKSGRSPYISNFVAIFPFVLSVIILSAMIWLRIADAMSIFTAVLGMASYIMSGVALLIFKGKVGYHSTYY